MTFREQTVWPPRERHRERQRKGERERDRERKPRSERETGRDREGLKIEQEMEGMRKSHLWSSMCVSLSTHIA